MRKSHFQELDFFRIDEGMERRCTVEEFQSFVVVARRIWLRRNTLIHEGTFSHPNAIVVQATTALKEYHYAQMEPKVEVAPLGHAQSGGWEALQLGWHKVNWDAALGVQSGRMGLGVVIRDHMGRLVAARSLSRQGGLDPDAAEAMAALLATQTAHELGIQ